ncbi:hypothetical protein N307_04326, partial [Dryobates pubescens]
GKLGNTGQGGETRTSHSDVTPSPTTVLGSPPSEIQAAEVSASPPFPSSGKSLGMKAVKKTSNPTTSTASQSNRHSDSDFDKDKMGSSSSIKRGQSSAREVPLQQELTTSQDTATVNRLLKQSSHSAQKDASSKASGFETT